jgi:hypothetical protein
MAAFELEHYLYVFIYNLSSEGGFFCKLAYGNGRMGWGRTLIDGFATPLGFYAFTYLRPIWFSSSKYLVRV